MGPSEHSEALASTRDGGNQRGGQKWPGLRRGADGPPLELLCDPLLIPENVAWNLFPYHKGGVTQLRLVW